jgi:hypothetical protein
VTPQHRIADWLAVARDAIGEAETILVHDAEPPPAEIMIGRLAMRVARARGYHEPARCVAELSLAIADYLGSPAPGSAAWQLQRSLEALARRDWGE